VKEFDDADEPAHGAEDAVLGARDWQEGRHGSAQIQLEASAGKRTSVADGELRQAQDFAAARRGDAETREASFCRGSVGRAT
jgi:hypothetical protein